MTLLSVTPTGQAATCWVTSSGDLLVASNAGGGTVTALTRLGRRTDDKTWGNPSVAAGTGDSRREAA